MAKLHEILAVEKTRVGAASQIMAETLQKFGKFEWFQGHHKTLKMLEESPQNDTIEKAATETKALPTTVQETLEYAMGFWAKAEDVTYQKNLTNRNAISDLVFRGTTIVTNVPVDELMGLEVRLEQLRNVMKSMPTLPATASVRPWTDSGRRGAWIGELESTTKTEKTMVPIVLYPATDKHPAQVKESTQDKVVGRFELTKVYGAATSQQKADMIAVLDELIGEVKQARMRANSVEVVHNHIGETLVKLILAPLQGE